MDADLMGHLMRMMIETRVPPHDAAGKDQDACIS
jgi:hypothetical protein